MHPACSLAALSFHPQTCRLIFAGKAMNDDKMAKDYNIEVRGGLGRELDGGAWCGEVCVPKRSLGEVATCTAQG